MGMKLCGHWVVVKGSGVVGAETGARRLREGTAAGSAIAALTTFTEVARREAVRDPSLAFVSRGTLGLRENLTGDVMHAGAEWLCKETSLLDALRRPGW